MPSVAASRAVRATMVAPVSTTKSIGRASTRASTMKWPWLSGASTIERVFAGFGAAGVSLRAVIIVGAMLARCPCCDR
jgi:hypothetical protein